ncbi:site-specific DNA-methyltransferase [bacterium (Candidatus Gribaldobacteria) CG_4_10_14_0_8_um_filter_33_9]|uniref:Methyltransferase n=1 Tax=bacterium (Candidatus Gribaldobacteria) CG_4_10_14_0_8_um_filter_33_9 TaxID=2014266 RepID=A0A2M7RNN8_9BACT|nr:MAG: site-specific DNA-methyltransferase [bacterium (Candidatus Gribaldobacteria) CG_4_10_14_0_8_um_filter_33_9]
MMNLSLLPDMLKKGDIVSKYNKSARATLYLGDRLELLSQIPKSSVRLIVTSPPYNMGKSYEKKTSLDEYLEEQEKTIKKCVEILAPDGSICWQVGNHVNSEIYPLDTILYPIFKKFGLHLRNRIIWHFGHGLHCAKRFSGRYETIVWFTKSDDYVFNLDPVRVPQKYPGKKSYKGENKGEYSGNPLGKNPSDVWEIPNVKSNHIEKTAHPCQFPIELVERLVLALTKEGDLVVDPYLGVGTAICAAVLHNRRGAGADIMKEYIDIAKERVEQAIDGSLKRRPLGKPVYNSNGNNSLERTPAEFLEARSSLFPISAQV